MMRTKKEKIPLDFTDYEIPLLQAIIKLDGSSKPSDVYPLVEEIMKPKLVKHPEDYGTYNKGQIIWKNKTQWAREYLKRKGQIDASERGIWKITQSGRERVRIFENTGKDTDEGLIKLNGIEPEIEKVEDEPEEAFNKLDENQKHPHYTGDILDVRGIVYEPINEMGVILLFAAIAYELDFRIEAIRSKYPDAQLRRKNIKGRWTSFQAEFEFKSSDFKTHGHDKRQCDLIICWEHDWEDCPLEVLSLKDKIKIFKEKSIAKSSNLEQTKVVEKKSQIVPSNKVTEAIEIFANYKKGTYTAIYYSHNKIVFDGKDYSSPSAACVAVTKKQTCSGWTFWRFIDKNGKEQLLDKLR